MKPEENILQIHHAHKYYNRGRSNELHVMDDIELSLPAAGMVAIFGQSGCGKTTLLNAIGGLDNIAEGSIELFGKPMSANSDRLRNRYIGYIFQNYNLNSKESVYENVADALRLCGITDATEIRTRVLASLANVGMEKYIRRTPDTLSGGQQQRVAIARALVKSPAVILADEPTGNLDEANTVRIMDILKEISRTHLVLLVTHEVNLVDYYCDRVIRIVDGRITEDRRNEKAEGYTERDKHAIYLGELERTEGSLPGLSLTRYGPADTTVKLRLITSGGHTYLLCDNPEVRILNEDSEIKVREGVFRPAARSDAASEIRQTLDMSSLPPIRGSHYGRLFRWKTALPAAWKTLFSQKQKRSTHFLRITLLLLSVILVVSTAVFALPLQTLIQKTEGSNPNLFYLRMEETQNYDALMNPPASAGIDGMWLTVSSPRYSEEGLLFYTVPYISAQTPVIITESYVANLSLFPETVPVAGTNVLSGKDEGLLTTALADALIASAEVGFLDSYEDLLNLSCENDRGTFQIRVVGIVPSEERMLLIDDLAFADHVLSWSINLKYDTGVAAQSNQSDWTQPLAPGELAVLNGTIPEGETVLLCGRPFRVIHSDCSGIIIQVTDYYLYCRERYGITIVNPETYVANGDPSKNRKQLLCEWLFEVFPQGNLFREFCRSLVDRKTAGGGVFISLDVWEYARTGNMAAYLRILERLAGRSTNLGTGDIYPGMPFGTTEAMYAEWFCHEKTGEWAAEEPTDEDALQAYRSDIVRLTLAEASFSAYRDETMRNLGASVQYVVSDADYLALSGSTGTTDPRFHQYSYGMKTDRIYTSDADWFYAPLNMMIHASDPEAAAAYLTERYGDALLTPEQLLQEITKENRGQAILGATVIFILLVLLCLCIFFIMRSSFLSRMREVGIYRAIGVTKKNLLFRFTVEALLLIILTVVIGFLLSSAVISYLSGGVLMEMVFYYPLWLAGLLLLVLFSVSLFFGILPVMGLLRRAPSEILAKYDI